MHTQQVDDGLVASGGWHGMYDTSTKSSCRALLVYAVFRVETSQLIMHMCLLSSNKYSPENIAVNFKEILAIMS